VFHPLCFTLVGSENTTDDAKFTFDTIFERWDHLPVYGLGQVHRSEYVNGPLKHIAIINPASRPTLLIPPISFNARDAVNSILQDAKAPPDTRNKAVTGILRGMGGGKTRALEELRLELLVRSRVLPLAFSFNSGMDLIPSIEFKWGASYEVSYAMAVVARLAHVFYGIKLVKVVQALNDHKRSWGVGADADYPIRLIRAFLLHALAKLPSTARVNTIVVLADEVAKSEEKFSLQFGLEPGQRDLTDILRKALLDVRLIAGLDTTLVIASLTISPLGKTLSGRMVTAIKLVNLDPRLVLNTWWKVDPRFLLAAVALSNLPRSVEYAADYFSSTSSPSVMGLLTHVEQELRKMYQENALSKSYLRAVIYREKIRLTKETMTYLKKSLLINSLTSFGDFGSSEDVLEIVPDVSLILLAALSPNSASLLRGLFDGFSIVNKGDALEWYAFWWMRMRLDVLPFEPVLLSLLLGLDEQLVTCTSNHKMYRKVCQVSFEVSRCFVESTLPDSHASMEKFVQTLAGIRLIRGKVVLIKGHPKEAFEFLLAVYGVDGQVFVVFEENKSSEQKTELASASSTSRSSSSSPPSSRPFPSAQAAYMAELVSVKLPEQVKSTGQTAEANSVLKALLLGRYAYVYRTSHVGPSFTTDSAINLRQSTTEPYFGPLWNVYRAVREGGK
jgi:hypothetical protein